MSSLHLAINSLNSTRQSKLCEFLIILMKFLEEHFGGCVVFVFVVFFGVVFVVVVHVYHMS